MIIIARSTRKYWIVTINGKQVLKTDIWQFISAEQAINFVK
jgi:hypothetical protein